MTFRRDVRDREYELEKNLLSYNEALSTNKTLRKQINDLRKERSLFDKVYYNLEMDIMKKKKKLMDLIEDADKKEKVKKEKQNELVGMQSQVWKNKDIFQENYKNSLNDFEEPIQKLKMLRHEAKVKQFNLEEFDIASDDRRFSKRITMEPIGQEGGLMSRTDREMMDKYTSFFNTLFEETQMNDVDQIIAAFSKTEVDHNKVYDETLKINKEIEELEAKISEEKQKMAQLKQLSPEEMIKLNEVKELEAEIKRNDHQLNAYNGKINNIMRNVGSFRVE